MAGRKKSGTKRRASASTSKVDEICERIAIEIVSGALKAGERLPSVRDLATRYDVNPSTVQIIVSRLRAAGFVHVNPRSGFVVRDIELYGGIDTWRYIFKFAQRMPVRASALFENFLATRRVLVLEVARHVAKSKSRPKVDLEELRAAVDNFEALIAKEAPLTEIAAAEQQAARLFMRDAGQPVLLALYNTIGDIMLDVPAVLEAMYTEPKMNLRMWRGLVDRWERGGTSESDIEQAGKTLTAFHALCVSNFGALLETAEARAKRARR